MDQQGDYAAAVQSDLFVCMGMCILIIYNWKQTRKVGSAKSGGQLTTLYSESKIVR